MADDDFVGIDILIRQRLSRPSFARMISWEIQRQSEDYSNTCYASSHKELENLDQVELKADAKEDTVVLDKHQFDKDGSEEEDFSSSEESEYFSAEENFSICTPEDLVKEGLGMCDTEDHREELFAFKDNGREQTPNRMYLGDRKRSPSKKQKKKRRKNYQFSCTNYAEYTVPFRNVENFENINLCYEDFEQDVSETTDIPAKVASLMELCIKALWSKARKEFDAGYDYLPRPVQYSASTWKRKQNFVSIQLAYLYRNLAQVERRVDMASSSKSLRNVWSYKTEYSNTDFSLPGSDVSLVIPYMYASCGEAVTYCINSVWRISLYSVSGK